MYRQGTEADWIFLDLFKLHSQDYPGPCCDASLWTRIYLGLDLDAESHAESATKPYCLTIELIATFHHVH